MNQLQRPAAVDTGLHVAPFSNGGLLPRARSPFNTAHPEAKNELSRRTANHCFEYEEIAKIDRNEHDGTQCHFTAWHGRRGDESENDDEKVIERRRKKAILAC